MLLLLLSLTRDDIKLTEISIRSKPATHLLQKYQRTGSSVSLFPWRASLCCTAALSLFSRSSAIGWCLGKLTTVTHWWWCSAYEWFCWHNIHRLSPNIYAFTRLDGLQFVCSTADNNVNYCRAHTHTQHTQNGKHAVQSMMYYSVSFGYTIQVYFVD